MRAARPAVGVLIDNNLGVMAKDILLLDRSIASPR
jgi:hypothetical protein